MIKLMILGAIYSGTQLMKIYLPENKFTKFLKEFTKTLTITLLTNIVLSF